MWLHADVATYDLLAIMNENRIDVVLSLLLLIVYIFQLESVNEFSIIGFW